VGLHVDGERAILVFEVRVEDAARLVDREALGLTVELDELLLDERVGPRRVEHDEGLIARRRDPHFLGRRDLLHAVGRGRELDARGGLQRRGIERADLAGGTIADVDDPVAEGCRAGAEHALATLDFLHLDLEAGQMGERPLGDVEHLDRAGLARAGDPHGAVRAIAEHVVERRWADARGQRERTRRQLGRAAHRQRGRRGRGVVRGSRRGLAARHDQHRNHEEPSAVHGRLVLGHPMKE
jgi:hypothetical protein